MFMLAAYCKISFRKQLKIIEMATIGKIIRPKFYFHFNYVKDVVHYIILKLFVYKERGISGHTQAYFAIKKIRVL
jgi:hypothetical protein